jgi:hypothetical protein
MVAVPNHWTRHIQVLIVEPLLQSLLKIVIGQPSKRNADLDHVSKRYLKPTATSKKITYSACTGINIYAFRNISTPFHHLLNFKK